MAFLLLTLIKNKNPQKWPELGVKFTQHKTYVPSEFYLSLKPQVGAVYRGEWIPPCVNSQPSLSPSQAIGLCVPVQMPS